MTAGNFQASLHLVLQSEGGNDDDPADHGGRTSRGITQREFTAWLSEQGLPDKDVWTATDGEIKEIYHDEYWSPYCDLFPSGCDYLFFDMAVNSGPHEATLILQRSLGVAADGRIGPITREAAANCADEKGLIQKYTDQKRAFYYACHQPRFIKGWLNRCNDVQANATTLIGT